MLTTETNRFTKKKLALATMVVTLGLTSPVAQVMAQSANNSSTTSSIESTQHQYNIAAQSLSDALIQFGRQSQVEVSANSDLIANIETAGVQGTMTLQEAANILLAGTGLTYQLNGSLLSLVETQAVSANSNRSSGGITELAPAIVNAENPFGDIPEDVGFVAEYQTTATKMALPIRETPQAISVVTRDSMDARLVKDLSTAIELTAGVSNSGNGQGIRSGPGMFGGQGQADQKFVLRSQPSDIRSDGFTVGSSGADLSAYERVEVVKGPSGFYGQGSLGGFINMVRKKPQEEFDASLSVQLGSYNTYRTEMDVTGALNGDKNLRGRVTYAYEDAGSFVDDIESKRIMLAPSLEYIISDNTRVLTQLLYQKDEFDANPGVFLKLDGDQLSTYDNFSDPTELLGATGDKSNKKIIEFIARVDHEFSDRWLASLLLQTNKSTRDIIEGNGTSIYNYGSGYLLYNAVEKDNWERDYWAGEFRLEGQFDAFGQEHQLLIGVEHNDQSRIRKFGQAYTYIGTPETFSGDFADYGFLSKEDIPTTVDRENDKDNSAIYAQTVLTLQEKTKLLIGVRYDKTSGHLTYHFTNGSDADDRSDDNSFTKRIGLTHEFNGNISAYGMYAESFEPTLSEGRNGILDPITGESYEIGLKTDWFGNRLSATLAVYQHELDNRPLADPTNGQGESFSISSGLHRTEGIELELTGSPYPGLTIAAAASWMDNEFTEDGDPNKGLSIDGSVDNQFSLYANYELQNGSLKGFGLGATLVSVGDRQFINANEINQDNFYQMHLDGYERIDINLSYNGLQNWDMSLLIRNITDEGYIEIATGFEKSNYYGSPRAVLLQAKYHF